MIEIQADTGSGLDARAMLERKVRRLRQTIFKVICRGGGGHIPSSLSIAEILTVLYENVLNINPDEPDDPGRDRFIMSKGHASVALYSILAEKGFIDESVLYSYGHEGTILGGHPDMHKVCGVEASTGALGHGFGFGIGMALAGKLDGRDYRTIVLLGDGECQEGSIWEGALFASQRQLDNLTVIIDYNKLQALDQLDNIVSIEPLADKFAAFGFSSIEVDGHDIAGLIECFEKNPLQAGRPTAVIAHTVKGKGISFMENTPIWHYRMPNEGEMEIACSELGIGINEVSGKR